MPNDRLGRKFPHSEPSSTAKARVSPDIVCPACSCLCDDVTLHHDGSEIFSADRACLLGKAWFRGDSDATRPACRIAGQPSEVEQGLARAVDLLHRTRRPVVLISGSCTNDTTRAAFTLGDRLGAALDVGAGEHDSHLANAIAQVGLTTATLGEVRHRSNLLVLWGCNPATSHPRLLEHFGLLKPGDFVKAGHEGRCIVVVDTQETATSRLADTFIRIEPAGQVAALTTLRGLLQDSPLELSSLERCTGQPLSVWQDLARRMQDAQYGTMFFGPRVFGTSSGLAATEALLILVRDLNDHTRFVALPLSDGANATGVENVALWRTGYPRAIDFSRGFPRALGREFSAATLLRRRDADAIIVVGPVSMADLPRGAQDFALSLPRIVLSWEEETAFGGSAEVTFATSKPGIDAGGTMHRLDDIALPIRAVLPPRFPDAAELLARMEQRMANLETAARDPDAEIA